MVLPLGVTHSDVISIFLAWPILSPWSNPSPFSSPSMSHVNLLAGISWRGFLTHTFCLINTEGKGWFSLGAHAITECLWKVDGKTTVMDYIIYLSINLLLFASCY